MMVCHHHQYYRRCLRWAVTLLRRFKRTPAGKQATRSVSKSCHAAGFTLRYRRRTFSIDKTDTPTPPNETSNNVGCPRMSRVNVAALDTILQQ
ncbi:hypothetical protein [Nostoc sp.]|uniref:hypothetical protein n=1 Tax=Nostoc sp. TaxID=1180 RepID=UPI002FFD0887